MAAHRYLLNEDAIPTRWYNIAADLPTAPPPPLHPGTGQPVGPDDLAPLFPMSLIMQEVSTDRWIEIPDPVREVYALWRPTPLHRALALERELGTDCKIFYKYEGVSPAGSHKPNSSVAQAYYNKMDGTTRLATETGAGQWGSSLAFACARFGLECKVYMVRASYDQKPYRRSMIQTWGAEIVASPSPDTAAGRAALEQDPHTTGSLGLAISEAVEDTVQRADTHYALGSVLNHVLLHQTVIGQEAKQQLAAADADPDVIIGCVGGGSNFAGLAFPFLADVAAGAKKRIVAAEPTACPTLPRGPYGSASGATPMITRPSPIPPLGHAFIPPPLPAGGLRYHGMAPLVSHLVHTGLIEPRAYDQRDCFAAAITFARTEGIIPAPESSHAIRATIDEVERAREEGVSRTILFNLSGHGFFDMSAYDAYLSGSLVDAELDQSELDRAAKELEGLPTL